MSEPERSSLSHHDTRLANDAQVVSYLADNLGAASRAASTCWLWASLVDDHFWQLALNFSLSCCPATLQQALQRLWSQWHFMAAFSQANFDLITHRIRLDVESSDGSMQLMDNIQVLSAPPAIYASIASRQLSPKLLLEAWTNAFNSGYARELRERGVSSSNIAECELDTAVKKYAHRHSWWVACLSFTLCCVLPITAVWQLLLSTHYSLVFVFCSHS